MKIQNTKSKMTKGFSLVELLVVITIIAILSVVAYTAVGGQTINAKNSKRLQDINTIQQALELYFVKNNEYPVDIYDLSDFNKSYISNVPLDPTEDDEYYYRLGDNANGDGESSKTYVLGATMEDPESDDLEGYLVGNDDDFSVPWEGAGCGANVTQNTNNFNDCYPYDPNDDAQHSN